MSKPTNDSLLKSTVLSCTREPNRLIYQAMRQCYCFTPVSELENIDLLTESQCGKSVVDGLLANKRGHWSPLEQPTISFNVAYCPHDVMQQFRTHRHLSFSVQSFRYSSQGFLQYDGSLEQLEKLVYVRPVGEYYDRQGNAYEITSDKRISLLSVAHDLVVAYKRRVNEGVAPEDARGLLPFNIRQHFVVGGNLRAFLHMFDLRLKADTQPEFQQLARQLFGYIESWVPEIGEYYEKHRQGKAILSP